jgi:DNA-binding PadR family transcriptional regulator
MPRGQELPSLSRLEELILRLLIANGDLYGLQLVEASNGRLRRGTVYVTLDRMAGKGYVTSRLEHNATHAGLPRPLYRATGEGKRALAAWELAQRSMSGGSEGALA